MVLVSYYLDLITFIYNITSTTPAIAATSMDSLTSLLPEYSGVIIGTTCLLKILISLLLDCQYDHQLMRYYVWIIWRPLGFWLVNMLTIIVAIPKILFRKRGMRAR